MPEESGPTRAGSAKSWKRQRLWLRRTRKYLLFGLAIVLGSALLYLLLAVLLGLIPCNTGYVMAKEGTVVHVWTNGIHTGFTLPLHSETKVWSEFVELSGSPEYEVPAHCVSLSWGDRGIFVNTPNWSDLTLGNALHAVFLPSASVMHVSFWAAPLDPSDRNRKLILDDAQYKKLVTYIEASFARDANGHVKRLDVKGYKSNDDFYVATGSYHLFNTCNNWANGALKAAGVRTALWAPFDKAIFYQLPKD